MLQQAWLLTGMSPEVLWAKPSGGTREFLLACIEVHLEEQSESYQAQQRIMEQARRDAESRVSLPRAPRVRVPVSR